MKSLNATLHYLSAAYYTTLMHHATLPLSSSLHYLSAESTPRRDRPASDAPGQASGLRTDRSPAHPEGRR